jgi:hypothetical protein
MKKKSVGTFKLKKVTKVYKTINNVKAAFLPSLIISLRNTLLLEEKGCG